MTAHLTCRRRGCGAVLDVATDGHGRIVTSCRFCDRNRAGLCRDCPAPIANPKRMRCEPCRAVAKRAAQRRHDRNRWSDPDRRVILLEQRRRQRQRPEVREYRRQWEANYRARNPFDHIDRLIARERQRRYRQDPKFRQKESARKREWRRRQQIATVAAP